MAGSARAERGISQEPEVRPFASLTPEDVGPILGGEITRWNYKDGGEGTKIDGVGASILFNEYSYLDREMHNALAIYPQTSIDYEVELDHAEALISSSSLTVVLPLEAGEGIQSVTWATLSREGTTLFTRMRHIGQPWPADVRTDILKAAGRASARLQVANPIVAR